MCNDVLSSNPKYKYMFSYVGGNSNISINDPAEGDLSNCNINSLFSEKLLCGFAVINLEGA